MKTCFFALTLVFGICVAQAQDDDYQNPQDISGQSEEASSAPQEQDAPLEDDASTYIPPAEEDAE